MVQETSRYVFNKLRVQNRFHLARFMTSFIAI